MKVRKLIFCVCVVLFLIHSILVFAGVDPDLLRRFKLVKEDGQTVVEVSLGALLSLALERSTTVDMLANSDRMAEESLEALREMYNPVFSGSLAVQHRATPSRTNISGNLANPYFLSLVATDTTVVSASWNKKTRNGILYKITYQNTSSTSSSGNVKSEGDSLDGWTKSDDALFVDSLSASVSVPIFQDWGEVNRLPERRSQIGLEQSRTTSFKTKLELLSMVANIYWDLVGVHENIQTLKMAVKLSERFVDNNRTKLKLGILDPIELKQSESQLLLTRQNLLREIVLQKRIEDQIKVALNLEDLPYGYKPTEKISVREEPLEFGVLLEQVYKNNRSLALLNSRLKMSQLSLDETENREKTNLDFNVSYQMNGYGKTVSTAMAAMSETTFHDYQLGLSLSVPLFDKITPQKKRRVALEQANIHLQIANLKSQLKVQLQSVLRNLELAKEGINLASLSVSLMDDLLKKETEKFKVGKTTSFRVTQVQQDLTDANKNETLAKIRYEKTYLSLLVLTEEIVTVYDLGKYMGEG